ncbi:MAG: TolB-like 6-bladed beta-propeller domain-containing protein [Bacteroidaceae bacterium]|nr:TolB-like 6-bladed beta-propeller domain-containing protein [Bacteroidaceae bacterium]
MKRSLILIVIVIVFAICSCNNSLCYKYEVRDICIDSIHSSVLEGNPVDFYMEGVRHIYSVDSFIVVHREYDNYYYNVYSTNLDSIISFGTKGRSRNEFLSRPINSTKQIYNRDGDAIMPVMDNGICKEINITETIKKGSTIVDGSFQSIPDDVASAVKIGKNNEQLIYSYAREDDMYRNRIILPKLYYIDEKGKDKEYKVFERGLKCPNPNQMPVFYYRGVLRKQPEGNIVAMPMGYMNYIILFNTRKCQQSALHIYGTGTFEDGIPDVDPANTLRCFGDDAIILPDKLIVQYFGDYYKMIEQDPDYCGRLLAFNWDGELLNSYILHNYINEFAYFRDKKILYGANTFAEKIYTFYFDE